MLSALDTCIAAVAWAEAHDYRGYGKGDALNSPLLRALAGDSRLLRSGFVYLVSRSPINLRPMLGVEKRESPKALALLARTYLNLHGLTAESAWVGKATDLLDRLLRLSRVEAYSRHCWGAEYPRANPHLGADSYHPGAVITCEVAEAFLDAEEIVKDGRYLDIANSAAEFITRDLKTIEDTEDGLCFSYVPDHTWKVINSNAKTACLLARVASLTGDESLRRKAERNLAWVIGKQTDAGAWYYADPPEASHVKHDNYHTGFVLSSIYGYMSSTRDRSCSEAYARGLAFYERDLFLASGAPKWRHDRVYPLDIKSAAQGILNFSLASHIFPDKLKVAKRISAWMMSNMWEPEGRFYYQKGRYLSKKYTLMRWCQSWACYALTVLAGAQDRATVKS